MFNHKNMWANFQNENPGCIYYHLHDASKWSPFVNAIEEEIEKPLDPTEEKPLIDQT